MDKQKLFPVMYRLTTVAYVPLSVVMEHQGQALSNHSQTVQGLALRGGLDCAELAAVLEDREWYHMNSEDAWRVIWKVCAARLSSSMPVGGELLPCPLCSSMPEFENCVTEAVVRCLCGLSLKRSHHPKSDAPAIESVTNHWNTRPNADGGRDG